MRRLALLAAVLLPHLAAAGTFDAFLRLTLGPTRYVTSVTVTPTSSTMTPGSSQNVSYSILPTNATSFALSWTKVSGCDASDSITPTSTSTVSGTVSLSAYNGGTLPRTCVIRATATDQGTVYGQTSVTIQAQLVTSVVVLPSATILPIAGNGGTYSIQGTALPSNASNKTLNWTVTEGATCGSVSPTSTTQGSTTFTAATPTYPATCHVVATAADGSGQSATSTVTVVDPAGLYPDPTAHPNGALITLTYANPTWSSGAQTGACGTLANCPKTPAFSTTVATCLVVTATTSGNIVNSTDPITISDDLGLTFTRATAVYQPGTSDESTEIWTAPVSGNLTNEAITFTSSGSVRAFEVYALANCGSVGATATDYVASGGTAKAAAVSLTPQEASSWLFVTGFNGSTATPSPDANNSPVDATATYSTWQGMAARDISHTTGATSLGWTNSIANWVMAGVEVKVAATGGASATLTAQSATGAIGNVSATGGAVATLTGQTATGSIASVSSSGGGGDGSATLTAIAATGTLGAVKAGGGAALTARSGTGTIANVSASGGASRTLVAQAATGSLGNVSSTGGASRTLTAQTATGSVGNVTGGGGASLVAVAGTGAIANVSSSGAGGGSGSATLTAIAATGSLGAITAAGGAAATLTATAATGALRTLSAAGGASRTLTAVAASGALGNLASGGGGALAAQAGTGTLANMSATGGALATLALLTASGAVADVASTGGGGDGLATLVAVAASGVIGNVASGGGGLLRSIAARGVIGTMYELGWLVNAYDKGGNCAGGGTLRPPGGTLRGGRP